MLIEIFTARQSRQTMQHPKFMIAICLLTVAMLSACVSSNQSGPLTLESMYENLSDIRDSTVVLDGVYLGWKATDCAFPGYASAQQSRSDWICRIGDACVYVTGGKPQGADPMVDAHANVHLTAIVRATSDRKIYLEFVSGILK